MYKHRWCQKFIAMTLSVVMVLGAAPQLVGAIMVLSKDKILIRFKDGTEIEQII